MSFTLAESDIRALALGSSLLACGGGGNAYYGYLVARDLLRGRPPVRVIDAAEMDPGSLAVFTANIGAPLVMIEKPPSLAALKAGFEAVNRSLGDRVGALVAAEVGGSQSMLPLLLAGLTGLPLLDGDGTGRAFPEAQMCTFLIYGMSPGLPAAFSDDHGLLWRFPAFPLKVGNGRIGGGGKVGRFVGVAVERVLRRYCARKGGWIYATFTLDHSSLERTLVQGTMSLARDLGRAVESARANGVDPVEAALGVCPGRLLVRGKIVDVERSFRKGHDWGTVRIEGLDADHGRRVEIQFKNEYLVLSIDGEAVVTVPDLITIVETETGTPITTEIVRTGLRVSVLGMPCSPLYRTPEALRVV
jgi:DUF917 family protein